jgi:hypothetical protein
MEIGEKIAKANELFGEDKCPFCNKAEHPFPDKKKIDISKIKSKPASLGCGDLSPKQAPGKYGRAKHHLIPAHQCYTRLHRIAAMGQSVGYDINGKQNGIPLPTVWNRYVVNGESVKFGDLDDSDPEKNEIRNRAMKATGAQWHVGNHHYDIPELEDSTEDMGDEGELDHKPYDEVVLQKLLDIADKLVSHNLCETDEQDKVKEFLDKLCKEIHKSLTDFENGTEKSFPYYVSKWAMAYKNN